MLPIAITKGLTYLSQIQLDSGEFPTYRSTRLDMSDATRYESKSVYISAAVIHGLCYLPKNKQIEIMQERAGEFLAQQKEDDGSWNYDGKNNWTVPADLDETACVQAALIRLGDKPDLRLYALLWRNEVAPGGPYYTWIGVNDRPDYHNARQLDTLTNANLLYCCGLLNISLPGAVAYLQETIRSRAFSEGGMYCPHPHFLIYTYTRAFSDGDAQALASVMPDLQEFVLNQLPPPQKEPSAFNLACVTTVLLNLQAPAKIITPWLTALLAAQRADGSWPPWAAYIGYSPDYHGSPALTTAIALEAIGKYKIGN